MCRTVPAAAPSRHALTHAPPLNTRDSNCPSPPRVDGAANTVVASHRFLDTTYSQAVQESGGCRVLSSLHACWGVCVDGWGGRSARKDSAGERPPAPPPPATPPACPCTPPVTPLMAPPPHTYACRHDPVETEPQPRAHNGGGAGVRRRAGQHEAGSAAQAPATAAPPPTHEHAAAPLTPTPHPAHASPPHAQAASCWALCSLPPAPLPPTRPSPRTRAGSVVLGTLRWGMELGDNALISIFPQVPAAARAPVLLHACPCGVELGWSRTHPHARRARGASCSRTRPRAHTRTHAHARARQGGELIAHTETASGTYRVHPETLETLGRVTYRDHGVRGMVKTAHPHTSVLLLLCWGWGGGGGGQWACGAWSRLRTPTRQCCCCCAGGWGVGGGGLWAGGRVNACPQARAAADVRCPPS